jgi:hypothetical protein
MDIATKPILADDPGLDLMACPYLIPRDPPTLVRYLVFAYLHALTSRKSQSITFSQRLFK